MTEPAIAPATATSRASGRRGAQTSAVPSVHVRRDRRHLRGLHGRLGRAHPAVRGLPAGVGFLGDRPDRRLRGLRLRPDRLPAAVRRAVRLHRPPAGARRRDRAGGRRAAAVRRRRQRRRAARRAGAAGHRHRRRHDDARRHAGRPEPAARAGPGGRGQRRRPGRRPAPSARSAAGRSSSSPPRQPISSSSLLLAGMLAVRRGGGPDAGDRGPAARRPRLAGAPAGHPGPAARRRLRAGADPDRQLGARRALPLPRAVGRRRSVRPDQPPGRRARRHPAVRHRRDHGVQPAVLAGRRGCSASARSCSAPAPC